MKNISKYAAGIQRFFRGLRFGKSKSSLPKTSAPFIKDICRELRELSGLTEHKFLHIGKNLFSFHNRTRAMSSMVTEVADIMGGASITAAIADLENILNQVERFERVSSRNVKTVNELLELLNGMSAKLRGFERTVKNLEMLGIYTRMENARIGGLGVEFTGLADEIGALCREIQNKSRKILDHTDEVDTLLASAMSSMGGQERERKSQARDIMRDAKSSIDDLRERHAVSLSAVQSVKSLSDEVSKNMEEIVSSMQFHDITRQQMEHVIEALEDLIGERDSASSEGPKGAHGAGQDDAPHGMEVCELQLEQLRYSKKTLVSAVQRILENLLGVSGNIARMSREAHLMLNGATGTYSSSLSDTDARLSALTSMFSDYETMGGAVAKTVNEVANTVGEMIGFVSEIESIENKVKLIALNSSIKAARLGEKGIVFSELANEIQRLVEELVGVSLGVTENLKSINSVARTLSSMERGDDDGALEAAQDKRYKNLVATIHEESGKLSDLMEKVNTESDHLVEEIQDLASKVTVHTEAADLLDQAIEGLNRAVAGYKALLPDGTDAPNGGRTQSLQSRYTMESEREVHRTVVKEDSAYPENGHTFDTGAANAEENGSAKDEDDDFGDNVELF